MFAMTIHLAVIASGFCVAISHMLLGDCSTGKSSHVRNDTSSCCHCERFLRGNLPPGDQGIAALVKAAMFAMTLHLAVIASGFCVAISQMLLGDCFTGKSSHVRNDTSSCCHCERFLRGNLPDAIRGLLHWQKQPCSQ
jgi:uncharacterized Fe-S cluster protein YjdI